MTNDRELNPEDLWNEFPESNAVGDAALAAGKGVLSLIPGGGLLAETVGAAVAAKARERDEAFWRLVVGCLVQLGQKVESLLNENATEDEDFVAYAHRLLRASQETADPVKRELLAKALAKSGSWSDLATSQRDRFTSLISRYSMLHITLLNFFADPSAWLKENGAGEVIGMMDNLGHVIRDHVVNGDPVYPGEVLRVIAELNRDDLTDIPSMTTAMTSNGTFSPHIKALGREFLDFIQLDF
ncbi:hypothetical protein [Arthrobacter sp. KNU40]|uniref:hypothetical protein n=1 Tax=Arthrobacter sp. KNU40 TaxID=3447965 RepID=UPI003F645C42